MIQRFPESPSFLIAALAVLFFAPARASADQLLLFSLHGASEVPPVSSEASGSGQITVLADGSISGRIRTRGFVPTAAHIHEGAVGRNGPPIMTLEKTAADCFEIPAAARLSDEQYASFMAGTLYVNVHGRQNPDGEIRGQLRRPPAGSGLLRPARRASAATGDSP